MRACQIAVLARTPVPGQVKTRLVPRLGAERAAALQAHLIELALQRAHDTGVELVLWVNGPVDPHTAELASRCNAELRCQPDGDLGQRMLAAAVHAFNANRSALIIGTDCPAQRPDDLVQARTRLDSADVVLQPALDGGYVLIGMNEPQHALFTQVAWGSDTVLGVTRQRCAGLGLDLAELPALPDLDTPTDLDAAIAAGLLDRRRWS